MKTRLLPAWLVFVVVYFFLFIIDYRPTGSLDYFITYTFFLNACIAAYSIFSDQYSYSLNKIYWIFCFIFLAVIPTYQYQVKQIPWGNNITQITFLYANLIILVSFLFYKAARQFIFWRLAQRTIYVADHLSVSYVQKAKAHGWIIFVALCVILIASAGIENIWLRGDLYGDVEMTKEESTINLLYNEILRGGIIYYVLVSIILKKKNIITPTTLAFILGLAFIANFPLSTARFFAAAFYISILLMFNFRIFKKRHAFIYIILGVLLLVFPLLGVTRYKKEKAIATLQNVSDIFRDSFLVGDFDAYSSLCRTIEHVSVHGVTAGKQLLSVFLFFVPRNMWPGKAVGSGAYIYGEMRYGFTNISCPYIAEGYINFGFIGTVIFIVFLGAFLTYYDVFYWRVKSQVDNLIINYNIVYYPVLLGLLFFILRGDLLSSYSHAIGLYMAGYIFHNYLYRRSVLA